MFGTAALNEPKAVSQGKEENSFLTLCPPEISLGRVVPRAYELPVNG